MMKMMSPEPRGCPENSEQIAEDYVLGRLSPAEMAAFDLHVESCEQCADLLGETIEFIEAFQSADKD